MMANPLLSIVSWILEILGWYRWALVAYAVVGWVPQWRDTSFYRGLEWLAEPFVGIFRKFVAPIAGIDLSFLVAVIVLDLFIRVISNLMFRLLMGPLF